MQPALDSVEILAARITTRFAAIAASSLRSSGSGLSGAAVPPLIFGARRITSYSPQSHIRLRLGVLCG